MFTIAEQLGLKPNFNLGSKVSVKDKGKIYDSAESIANSLGYPDAAVSSIKQLQGIKPIIINNNDEGKIVAIGKHPNYKNEEIFVIEVADNKHFLISKNGLKPLEFS